jgi:hypothetical protein
MRRLVTTVLLGLLVGAACSEDDSSPAKPRPDASGGASGSGTGGSTATGGAGGSGGTGGTGGSQGSGGSAGTPGTGGAAGISGAAGADAGNDAADAQCPPDSGGLDAGPSRIPCSALLGQKTKYDPATLTVTLDVSTLPSIVSGTFNVYFQMDHSLAVSHQGSVAVAADTVTIDLSAAPNADAGSVNTVQFCEIELVDHCGRHFATGRFNPDSGADDNEMLNFDQDEGGATFTSVCRYDSQLCND